MKTLRSGRAREEAGVGIRTRSRDLTQGGVASGLLLFAVPMILGNLVQQCYNLVDTWVVGKFVGVEALSAVGSSFTLMSFLTSFEIGMCMGCGALFSYYLGRGDAARRRDCIHVSFVLLGTVSLAICIAAELLAGPILHLLQIPSDVMPLMRRYVVVVFLGIPFVFLHNYCAYLLRSTGDSTTPVVFLGAAAVLNIVLDILFVIGAGWGISGAAWATVIAQASAGAGLGVYVWTAMPDCRLSRKALRGVADGADAAYGADKADETHGVDGADAMDGMSGGTVDATVSVRSTVREVLGFSIASGVQQSVLSFGILMVQGLVNSFGVSTMAAFAAGVKIHSLAFMPAQELGNAYSIFLSRNYGAGRRDRMQAGTRTAIVVNVLYCLAASAVVVVFAAQLLSIFIDAEEAEAISTGIRYMRIEGSCYVLIGMLFLLYGYFRGTNRPQVALALTCVSLGTRVLLAYTLAATIGATGIWCAIPIGWGVADFAGLVILLVRRGSPGHVVP